MKKVIVLFSLLFALTAGLTLLDYNAPSRLSLDVSSISDVNAAPNDPWVVEQYYTKCIMCDHVEWWGGVYPTAHCCENCDASLTWFMEYDTFYDLNEVRNILSVTHYMWGMREEDWFETPE